MKSDGTQNDVETIQILNNVQKHFKEWEIVSPTDFKVTRLSGLTNQTSKVEIHCNEDSPNTLQLQQIKPQILVHRQFGSGGGLIDRKQEAYTFDFMNHHGLGPMNYTCSETYRLEEWITNFSHPTQEQFDTEHFQVNLIKTLVQLHSLTPDQNIMSPKPLASRILLDNSIHLASFLTQKDKILDQNNCKNQLSDEYKKYFHQIEAITTQNERRFLQKLVAQFQQKLDNVFCHNDPLAGNVFVSYDKESNKINKDIILIDYEYAQYNLRGFDIAGMFQENQYDYNEQAYPFFGINRSKFPSPNRVHRICQYYVLFDKFLKQNQNQNENQLQKQKFAEQAKQLIQCEEKQLEVQIKQIFKNDIASFEADVENLKEQIYVCLMLVNYFWGIWAINKCDDLSFGYLEYADSRYQNYMAAKQTYLQLYQDKF